MGLLGCFSCCYWVAENNDRLLRSVGAADINAWWLCPNPATLRVNGCGNVSWFSFRAVENAHLGKMSRGIPNIITFVLNFKTSIPSSSLFYKHRSVHQSTPWFILRLATRNHGCKVSKCLAVCGLTHVLWEVLKPVNERKNIVQIE